LKRNLITAGVDEVGRGCLAGPVVSAAVILNENIDLRLLKDSKKINFKNRLKIAKHIKLNSHYGIGVASVEEILNFIKIFDAFSERFPNWHNVKISLTKLSCLINSR